MTLKIMKEFEDILKKIMEFNHKIPFFMFSCDIYYNDLDNTFVAKLIFHTSDTSNSIHFRNKQVQDSLLDAYNYLLKVSKNPGVLH